MSNQVAASKSPGLIAAFGNRYGVQEDLVLSTLKATAFKQSQGNQVSNEQMISLLVVANEYHLNPFTREIYAFAANGGINPIVSIDGWLKIINGHPDMDGMEFDDKWADNKLVSITCRIFRKGRSHPTTVTEYYSECFKSTMPWKQWPVRMLRHKATIQCARYAFSLSGISDLDEAERIQEAQEVEVTGEVVVEVEQAEYPASKFEANYPIWVQAVANNKKTVEEIIVLAGMKGRLTDEQVATINEIGKGETV